MFISHSECLVQNQVMAACQQDEIVQGVKCGMTSVLCVLYNVCKLNCTRNKVSII